MGERGKGEVSGQPTAQAAYIGKGGPTSLRVIGREKGKKGKACARYGYRYPYRWPIHLGQEEQRLLSPSVPGKLYTHADPSAPKSPLPF